MTRWSHDSIIYPNREGAQKFKWEDDTAFSFLLAEPKAVHVFELGSARRSLSSRRWQAIGHSLKMISLPSSWPLL